MDKRREQIAAYADERAAEYQKIALDIHARPEVSNYEFFASETLSALLCAEGFDVEMPAAGHRTGFAARYGSAKAGPTLAFLAEYDALEGLGHGCGHNLFGVTSVLAAASLKRVIDDAGGEIRVYGTPGEEGGENGSAKGSFVREGYFADVDAALCVHPGDRNLATDKLIACIPVDIEFWGKSSHAAAAPEQGINALDGLLLTYTGINALRQHLTDDVRIHGIITSGGKAPNVVPDYAAAKFYLRAATSARLREVYAKIEKIVEGAALQTGAKGRMQPYQNWIDNQVPTPLFDAVYEKNLRLFGEEFSPPRGNSLGSSDVGNVSQIVPTIQPHIRISDRPIAGHSPDFVEASKSALGLASIPLGAKALAFTALDLIEDPALFEEIKAQHRQNVNNQ